MNNKLDTSDLGLAILWEVEDVVDKRKYDINTVIATIKKDILKNTTEEKFWDLDEKVACEKIEASVGRWLLTNKR